MTLVRHLLEPEALLGKVAETMARDPGASMLRLLSLMVAGASWTAAAVYVGTHWLTMQWNFDLGFMPIVSGRINPVRAAVFAYFVGPALLAFTFFLMAPLYGQPRRPHASLAVAVVGTLPIYVASVTMFFMPAVLLVALAFLVSCFWWGLGAQRLLGIKPGDAAEFTGLAIIGASVMLQFASALLAQAL